MENGPEKKFLNWADRYYSLREPLTDSLESPMSYLNYLAASYVINTYKGPLFQNLTILCLCQTVFEDILNLYRVFDHFQETELIKEAMYQFKLTDKDNLDGRTLKINVLYMDRHTQSTVSKLSSLLKFLKSV